MLPANKYQLAFLVSARVFVPLVLPFCMKLPLYGLSTVLRPVVGILWRQCMIIQATMDDFSRRPSGPSPSKIDAATETRLQVEALFANLGLTVHPKKGAVIGTRMHPALPLVCRQPRRRFLGEFSGKLPHTPSKTALPQRRDNLLWYPKDGVGPLTFSVSRLIIQRRRQHHERDRAHGPRGTRRCQPQQACSLHYSYLPFFRGPARGRLAVRIVSPLVLVRFCARSAGGHPVRHAL